MTRTKKMPVVRTFALVYQAGLANVFEIQEHLPGRRVMQGSFLTCEVYASALMEMGAEMEVHFCNKAGDIADQPWDTRREDAPFTENMHPRFLRMAVGFCAS